MNEIERLRIAWCQAVWEKDYQRAREITDLIMSRIANDGLIQELWPGAQIMPVGQGVGYHD
jgi:hypothetical protein